MQRAQFFQSPDGPPLCASRAHESVPWPRDVVDVQWLDRCGAGWLTAGRTVNHCFGYEGERAALVMLAASKSEHNVAWQDRADGMRIRKPKE